LGIFYFFFPLNLNKISFINILGDQERRHQY